MAVDGAQVLMCARGRERLEAAASALVARLPDAKDRIATRVVDGLAGSEVAAAVAEAGGSAGLDIAVSVPGGGNFSPILAYDDDDFSRTIDANVRPIFLVIKYAGKSMVRRGGGSIVAVSSTAAVMSSPFLAAYCAAKAACDQLVKVAADELGRHGVFDDREIECAIGAKSQTALVLIGEDNDPCWREDLQLLHLVVRPLPGVVVVLPQEDVHLRQRDPDVRPVDLEHEAPRCPGRGMGLVRILLLGAAAGGQAQGQQAQSSHRLS